MNSLRNRLFVILVAATGIIWLVATCWIYVGARREIESVLDDRLQEAARMASSIIPSNVSPSETSRSAIAADAVSNARQLSCQIWSMDGRLVARSNNAPEEQLSEVPEGFSERRIRGDVWRVFTIQDSIKGVRVLVGDRLNIREHLVTEIIKGLLAPALLIIPLLGFMIWASLHKGLMPLREITRELKGRSADDMSAMSTGNVPVEIQPLVSALNGLFAKVRSALQHEREITAFAAHELRTPLAGLRMQAQISLASTDPETRDGALRQILISVDRTTRLVRQLLALSKLDATRETVREASVNIEDVLYEITDALPVKNREVLVVFDESLADAAISANRELLSLALRNLHENAVGHMSEIGEIRWFAKSDSMQFVIGVEDQGPGIPDDEIALVTNRFFRGRHKSPSGSGLGLAIVELAVGMMGAELHFANRQDERGLRVEILWRISKLSPPDAEAEEPWLELSPLSLA